MTTTKPATPIPPAPQSPAPIVKTDADAPSTALAPKPPAAIGLMPRTVDEAWRLATIMAKSELVPKSYRDRPEDVLVAMMYGAEVGLTPAQAVTGVYVTNGKPGLYGEALLGVIMASPLYVDHDEYYLVDGERRDTVTSADLAKPTTTAICVFVRRGAPRPTVRKFSIEDAKRSRLIGKAGPWTEYPQIMLRMRARGFAARDAFPDLLRGIRTAEELMDTPSDAVTVDDVPVVRRLSDTPPAAHLETTRLDAARVDAVTQHDDGTALVILSTGVRVIVPDLRDAHALAQLVTTDARIVATVVRGPSDELTLATFTTPE